MLVGYARVSTQEQNLDLQIIALQDAGGKKIFTEKASGGQRDRPELIAAMDYVRPGEDVLVVWKLDRLARSLKQLIETVEKFEAQKIGFLSLNESINTTTSGGRLIFHIFASLAEFERSIIRERTTAGLRAAKQNGRIGGRPSALKEKDLIIAKTLLQDPNITVEDAAKRMQVAPSTLYRYFHGGRSSVQLSFNKI
jgi:DNA invertase Pin-like site-specific DNA recombinase